MDKRFFTDLIEKLNRQLLIKHNKNMKQFKIKHTTYIYFCNFIFG